MIKALINGANSSVGRFLVEMFWLAVSGAATTLLNYSTQNTNMLLSGVYLIVFRLVLGGIVNLANKQLANFPPVTTTDIPN